jgi:hypothetical protein
LLEAQVGQRWEGLPTGNRADHVTGVYYIGRDALGVGGSMVDDGELLGGGC